ncbi:Wall-associated receptor kinase 2 [Bienertia sinuspersici]
MQPLLALLLSCHLSLTLLIFLTATPTSAATTAKPGCPTTCGNITVPFPFGIIHDGYSCSLSKWYSINCNTSFNPPKPFWGPKNHEIMEISETGQIRIKNTVARKCYGESNITDTLVSASIQLKPSIIDNEAIPFAFSDTANKFIVTGCDDIGVIAEPDSTLAVSACITLCSNEKSLRKYNGSCSGIGCCQTTIPKGLTMVDYLLGSARNHRIVMEFNQCGYVFLGDHEKFTFNVDDLSDPSFVNRTRDDVPVVVEWVVGVDESCAQAQRNPSTYACQNNATCSDFDIGLRGGYRCHCLDGYEGNPYLSPGCTG